MRRHWSLSARILAAQIAVLAVTGSIGFALWALHLRHVLDQQYERRALAIAESVAAMPQVGSALAARDPNHVIAALAGQIRLSTGATYVVVADRSGIRYSHPNPALIGKSKEPSGQIITRDGRVHVGIDHGSLGLSANGKAPIFDARHTVIGEVSVGVLERRVSSAVWSVLPSLAGYLAVAVAIGVIGAYLLARRLKRQTFGLELDEIAALVQEREATLHGIREGVVALDTAGRVTLMNDHAYQLLGVPVSSVGMRADELLQDGKLRELLSTRNGDHALTDQVVLVNGRLVVVSRTPVAHNGVDLGSVVTLRDRTELETALRELDDVRSLTDALRAQQHEFSNRMHVVAGLLELGRDTEAMRYAQQINGATAAVAAELERTVDDPRLVALLLAKSTVAAERGVRLVVESAHPLTIHGTDVDSLVSIAGNLIDNAMEAAGSGQPPAIVTVRLDEEDRELVIDVADTGPGIPVGTGDSIFSDGWSTKTEQGGRPRGLGLALVRQLVDRLGGTISVREGPGARFRVLLPRVRDEVHR